MAKSPTMNIQDSFLNQVRKDGTEVKISLLDGSSIIGLVRGFDNFTVVVQCRGAQHLLYKHAIAQVISRRGIRKDGTEENGTEVRSNPPSESKKEKGDAFNPIDLSGLHAEKDSD